MTDDVAKVYAEQKTNYDKIVECVKLADPVCLAGLSDTPEFKYLLTELEKRGYKRDEVLAALAAGAFEPILNIVDVTVELAGKVNRYVELVKSGDYLGAIRFLIANPDTVDVLNSLAGYRVGLDDILLPLAYHALLAGVKPDELASVMQDRWLPFAKAFEYYVYEVVRSNLEAGKIDEAVDFVLSYQHYVTRIPNLGRNIALLILGSVGRDARFTPERLLELARRLGAVSQEAEAELTRAAEVLQQQIDIQTTELILQDVKTAIDSGDAGKIRSIINKYGDVLSKAPLVVPSAGGNVTEVKGTTLLEYLEKLALFFEYVKPLLDSVNDGIQTAVDKYRAGDYTTARASAMAVIGSIDELMNKHADVIGYLRWVNSTAEGSAVSLDDCIRAVRTDLSNLRRTASTIEVLSFMMLNANNPPEIEKRLNDLVPYALEDRDIREFYVDLVINLAVAKGVRPEDVLDLLTGGSRSWLSNALSSVRYSATDLVSTRRDVVANLTLYSSMALASAGSLDEARRLIDAATKLGVDGRIIELDRFLNRLVEIGNSLRLVSTVEGGIRNLLSGGAITRDTLAKYTEMLYNYRSVIGSLVRSTEAMLAECGNILNTLKTPDGVPLSSAYSQFASQLKVIDKLIEADLNLASITGRLINMQYAKTIDDSINIVSSAQKDLDNMLSGLLSYAKDIKDASLRRPIEDKINSIIQYSTTTKYIRNILVTAKALEDNLNEFLKLLADGFAHPDETPKAIVLWRLVASQLKTIAELAETAPNKEDMVAFSNQYLKSISSIKTDLVKTDVRLEDILNIAEDQVGYRIPYEKPYIEHPIFGPVEKYIKIGIQQAADLARRIPLVGGYISSLWTGMASVVMGLLMPKELYEQFVFISEGARELFRKLSRGDLPGAVDVVFTPIRESFIRDPARFIGSLIGAALLAKVGIELSNRVALLLKRPSLATKLKPLVVNVLQGDPLGLFVDVIITPAASKIVSTLRALGSPPIGAKLKLVGVSFTKFFDSVGQRASAYGASVSRLASFVAKYATEIDESLKLLSDITNRKGINYVIALRDSLLDEINLARRASDDMIRLAKAAKESKTVADAITASKLRSFSDATGDALKKAFGSIELFSKNLKIEIDFNALARLRLKDIVRIRNEVVSILEYAKANVFKSIDAFVEFFNYIEANYPELFKRYSNEINAIMNMRGYPSPDVALTAAGRVGQILSDMALNYDPAVVARVFKHLDDILRKYGLHDIGDAVRSAAKGVVEIGQLSEALTAALHRFFDGVKKDVLAKLWNIDKIRSIAPDIEKSVRDANLSNTIIAVSRLVDAMDELSKAIRDAALFASFKEGATSLVNYLTDIRKYLTELGLDKHKFYSKLFSAIDELNARLNGLLSRLSETEARILEIEKVSELARVAEELGYKDLASRFAKEAITIDEAKRVLLDRVVAGDISQVAKMIKKIDELLAKLPMEPRLLTIRMALMNVAEMSISKLPELAVTPDILDMLKAFKEENIRRLPAGIVESIDNALAKRTLDSVIDVVRKIGLWSPEQAAGIDMSTMISIVRRLRSILEDCVPTSFEAKAIGYMLGQLKELESSIVKLSEGVAGVARARALVGIVDPALITSLNELAVALRSRAPLMAGIIDRSVSTIRRFVELLNSGDIDGALKLVPQVEASSAVLRFIGFTTNLADRLKSSLRLTLEKVRSLFGKHDVPSEELKVVSSVLDRLLKDVEQYGTVEGFGIVAANIEEVVGKTIRTHADMVPALRELLTTKRSIGEISIGGHRVGFIREASLLPSEVRIRYIMKLPTGDAYFDIVVRTIRYDPTRGEATNAVMVYTWYDPPVAAHPVAKTLSEMLKTDPAGFLRRIDPQAYDILSRTVVSTAVGDVNMFTLLTRAASYLGASLYASASIAASTQQQLGVLTNIVRQPNLDILYRSIVGMLQPVGDDLYDALTRIGIVPTGIYDKLLVGIPTPESIANLRPITVIIPDLPDVGKIVLFEIPEFKLILVPDIGRLVAPTPQPRPPVVEEPKPTIEQKPVIEPTPPAVEPTAEPRPLVVKPSKEQEVLTEPVTEPRPPAAEPVTHDAAVPAAVPRPPAVEPAPQPIVIIELPKPPSRPPLYQPPPGVRTPQASVGAGAGAIAIGGGVRTGEVIRY